MSEYYNIVPWYDSKEWHQAYHGIYSDTSNKEDALNLLLLWKARCPSLPSGIESTLSLLQVHLQDTTDSITSDLVLRLAYSSAIMRFVNHMLDTETAKGSSLYQAAKNLGVPDWIIDLRHDTAHSNNLPSIRLLREASMISLDWLRINYWEKYKQYIQDYMTGQVEIETSEDGKMSVLMNFCLSLSICYHSKIKKLVDIPDIDMRDSILNDVKDLFGDHIDLSHLKSISILGLINILNVQSKKLLKAKDAAPYVTKTLLSEDAVFLSLELLNYLSSKEFRNSNPKLSKSYVQCFEMLLTFLHTNDLILELAVGLVEVTKSDKSDHEVAQLAALWLSEILAALKRSKQFLGRAFKVRSENLLSKNKKELKLLYHHWFPNEKTTSLILDLQKQVPQELTNIDFIQPIISTYNPYLTHFVKDLLSLIEPEIPRATREKICKLSKLIAAPELFPAVNTTKVYTKEDLIMSDDDDVVVITTDQNNECDADEIPENSNRDTNQYTISDIWKLASKEVNWAMAPVGRLPWQKQSTPMES